MLIFIVEFCCEEMDGSLQPFVREVESYHPIDVTERMLKEDGHDVLRIKPKMVLI